MSDVTVYADGAAPDAREPAVGVGIGVGIAAVERDTGINKETLRVWERRYGFPAPARDAAGERLYGAEQVQRLRLIKRLLDAGHRPGRVVAAPPETLDALARPLPLPALAPSQAAAAPRAPEVDACVALLLAHEVEGLRRALSQAVLRRGLAACITQVFAPLTARIGELWMSGEVQVFEEHIYSESMQLVLRQAIQALPSAAGAGPRVLLTTVPGETHALGLLMAEALLTLEGAACLSLGVQTPLAQLPPAAAAHRADVVALSFSGFLAHRAVHEGLAAVREHLPPRIEVWAGGSSRALRMAGCPAGVRCLGGLEAIASELARWRGLLELPL
jgi:MerR family transcriptional regulator, light-induced transcriptional regulator